MLSAQQLQRRKFLMVLPALIFPFITGAFWALGGGSGTDAQAVAPHDNGLQVQLPDAHFNNDKGRDKLSFYDQVAADSAKHEEQIKNDPYFSLKTGEASDSLPEQQVYRKLAEINKALEEPPSVKRAIPVVPESSSGEAEIERLQQLMKGMQEPSTSVSTDPQMNQLSGMLDKILDIQHPERLQNQLEATSRAHQQVTYPVQRIRPTASISILDATQDSIPPFVSMPNHTRVDQNAIEAVVHEQQILVNGAVVKLRLLQPVYVKGQLIPKDHFLFGTATLTRERLHIAIDHIRDGSSLFPVQLDVYDLDGLPGIYIPGAITRDVTKQSTDNALQSVALNALNPSVGAQAAAAGIETAKSLLSKKIKLVRVQVKAGYKVLLHNKNEIE